MTVKAFELVPVIEKLDFTNDISKGSIRCLEKSNSNLYVGMSNCHIVHYFIDAEKKSSGKETFQIKLQRYKHFSFNKHISQLICCTPLGLLLFLCDETIYSVSMIGLELKNNIVNAATKEFFRGVTVMARNEKPPVFQPEEVQLCVAMRRKLIQIITLTKDKVTLLKKINIPEVTSVLSINFETLCTTFGKQYALVNYVSTNTQELFMYENENVKPVVKYVGDDEFLLNGPTNTMGVVVTKEGLSRHQPFTWCDGLRSVGYCFPYIIVLGKSTVTVHSMLDQRQKQAMTFNGGVCIDNFSSEIFIATKSSVLSFALVPYTQQIQMLLLEKRVEEAFALLVIAKNLSPKMFDESYEQQIKAQAGFVYFTDARFDKAHQIFIESKVDPREVICLYPLMLPATALFNPSRPLLHSIQDLSVVVKGSKTIFADAKKFLLKYLEETRNSKRFASTASLEIDTSLMKLYAECDHKKLCDFVSNANFSYKSETLSWLTQFKRYHALALYYHFLCETRNTISLWYKLLNKDIEDHNFPGIEFVVDFLSKLNDRSVVYDALIWLLKFNEIKAIDVIIKRDDLEFFRPDKVCELMKPYQLALTKYLEYLIYEQHYNKEAYHTHLASIYVTNVIKLMSETIVIKDELEQARKKLQDLLEHSNFYRIASILQKISKYPLYYEHAIIYGKMDQHERALKILVYKLKDFQHAERYCDIVSKSKPAHFRKSLFFTLLKVYLHSQPEDEVRPEHLLIPGIKFLNNHCKEFDYFQVLKIIPDDLSIDLIQTFISNALRQNLYNERLTKIECNLSKQDYLNAKARIIDYQDIGPIKILEGRFCHFCKKPFTEPTFARYPNNIHVHLHCSKDKNICPVTGKNFNM